MNSWLCLFLGFEDHLQQCSPTRVSHERQRWRDGRHHPNIRREFREGPRETQQRDTGEEGIRCAGVWFRAYFPNNGLAYIWTVFAVFALYQTLHRTLLRRLHSRNIRRVLRARIVNCWCNVGCRWCWVRSSPSPWRSPTSTRGRDAAAPTSSHEQHTHTRLPERQQGL